jgi:DNA ligase-1
MGSMIKQCMLAASEIPNLYTDIKYPCFIQQKLDGIRCLAINGVAYSRKMKLIPNRFVQEVFKELNLHGLDGELMVHGDFNSVQSAIMSEDGEPDFYLAVYDYWDSDLPFKERANIYTIKVLEIDRPLYVKRVISDIAETPEEVENLLGKYISQGYEGGILRSLNGKYKQGRSTFKEGYLLKLKSFLDDEATVIGFEEKMTNTNIKETDERGYSKRSSKKEGLLPANTLGSLQVQWGGVVFNIGSGFTDEQRKDIWDNQDKCLGKLVTFKYQELSSYGVPRFPTWKAFRNELDMSN